MIFFYRYFADGLLLPNGELLMPTKEELDQIFASPKKRERKSEGFAKRGSFKNLNSTEDIHEPAYSMCLFDRMEVLQKLKTVGQQKDSQEIQACLRKMQINGGQSFLAPLPAGYEALLDNLLNMYPHFHNVVNFIKQRMRLNALKEHPALEFGASILLDGPAGCGKTSFLMKLSRIFETEFASISCAAATNNFDLTGLSAGWGNGRPGKIYDLLINSRCPNPVILLDEIDKTNSQAEKQNFTGALYGLLEKNNAKSFQDEFIGIAMDASKINWFATSNDTTCLDEPIRDRFEVISVSAPSEQHLEQIIPQLFQSTVLEIGLQSSFAIELNESVVRKVLSYRNISIRRIQSVLKSGLANAACRVKRGEKKVSLLALDIPEYHSIETKQKIGFIH
ncbi:AAA ATPase, central region [Mariprofundus ferrooxydans PV-1]|uniref:AAA ATPase, central region n=2 Tax=Mariprofundus ferrooxydans TaxID=314344 RepID=Q0F1Q9_9PROT|nr:AAA ATPase, central region [Mariprofundus ferrooxydans PV-1]